MKGKSKENEFYFEMAGYGRFRNGGVPPSPPGAAWVFINLCDRMVSMVNGRAALSEFVLFRLAIIFFKGRYHVQSK